MPSHSAWGVRRESPASPHTGGRPVDLRDAIRREADQLIAEFPEIPAGSVLRTFARALRLARLYGTPGEDAVSLAANAARDTLTHRLGGGTGRLPAVAPPTSPTRAG